jgi:RNA polymerase-binding transcription factor DksA
MFRPKPLKSRADDTTSATRVAHFGPVVRRSEPFGFWVESQGEHMNMADPAVSLRDVHERTAQRVAELMDMFDAIVDASAASDLDEAQDPDRANLILDRAQLSSIVERAREQLAEINDALDRLRRGTVA